MPKLGIAAIIGALVFSITVPPSTSVASTGMVAPHSVEVASTDPHRYSPRAIPPGLCFLFPKLSGCEKYRPR